MRFNMPLAWLIPFICFSGGYLIARTLLRQKTVTVPSLIGKTADAALILLSEQNLNPRIVGLVDEPDLQPGTILNQIPRAHISARPYQTVFLIISSRALRHTALSWIGLKKEQIVHQCTEHGIDPILISVPHSTPPGTCFAQYPTEGNVITERPILYFSTEVPHSYIWPSLLDAPAASALEALKKQGVMVHIIGEYASADSQMLKKLHIIDQRPLPGSSTQYNSINKPSVHVRLGK